MGAPAESVIGGGFRAFDGNADGNVSRAAETAARRTAHVEAELVLEPVDDLHSPARPHGSSVRRLRPAHSDGGQLLHPLRRQCRGPAALVGSDMLPTGYRLTVTYFDGEKMVTTPPFLGN